MQRGIKWAISITKTVLLLMISVISIYGQEPCTNPPNGEGCLCSTAGILCTPDELDGFSFSMSSTENDGDLPLGIGPFNDPDLCPGIANQDGFPNNVNFFAFIVWCEDLTLDVVVSNCLDNPDDNQTSYGIQMAMFADCGSQYSGWDPVVCLTEGDDYCFDSADDVPAVQTFTANGLEIGGTYYFMLDGCAKSTCDITIDVVGVCGTGMIDDWTTGLEGPTATCVGATDTYTAEDVNGAVEFYYYLDGVLIEDGEDLTDIEITWDTPGTYVLCTDVSNLPCVPESDMPNQDCITIEVVGLGESMIMADPEILCPDEISTITVTGNNSGPEIVGYIIIVGPDGTVVQVVNDVTATLTYDMCGTFTAYFYNSLLSDMPEIPNVGDVWTVPDCSMDCCDLVSVDIMFEDDEIPVFTNPPEDFNVICDVELTPIEDLEWTDNCAGLGTVIGEESLTYTFCDGGNIKRNWVFTDSCGNMADYTQTITLDPAPEAVYDMEPADEDVTCDNVPTMFPGLIASNGLSGVCALDTVISPEIIEDIDDCDGVITVTWTYTDECDRTITYVQTITILPPEEAMFIDPPSDEEVACDAIPSMIDDLDYTNSLTLDCEITGTVSPTVVADTTICGGSITSTWEFTDVCDRVISHTQVITVTPPDAATLDMMPADVDIPCGDPIPDPIEIMATNGAAGSCNVSVSIVATVEDNTTDCDGTILYIWEYTDECGTSLSHTQTITKLPPDEASFTDLPADETILCSEIQPTPTDLSYSNNLSGDCEISGLVSPTIDDDSSVCGGSITYTWEVTDLCDRVLSHTQVLTIEPVPQAAFIDVPDDVTIDCGDPAAIPEPLAYTNDESGDCAIMGTIDAVQDGVFDICGGDVTFTWEFTDDCDFTIIHIQTITVNPAAEAEFQNPPADITLSCEDFEEDPPSLSYTNGLIEDCEITGDVDGILVGEPDACGSTVQYMWTFTDDCDRTIEYSQNITIEPAPAPVFEDLPPENVTYDCSLLPTGIPNLDYDNGATGDCRIAGTVSGFQSGTFDECGGDITYTWTITDECGANLSFTQFIELLPATDPVWIDPPEGITLDCGDEFPEPSPLEYTNMEFGDCLITGFAEPTVVEGEVYEYTWEYTNACNGNVISHTQFIEGVSSPDIVAEPSMVSICIGETFDLSTIVVTDLNGGVLTLQYFDDLGQEIFDPNVQPTLTTIYTILATNEDGCIDDVQVTVMVDSPHNAGGDGSVDVCANFGTTNFFNHIIPPFDATGFWFDIDLSGANLDDPMNVSFNGVSPGIYEFEYIIYSTNACPDDNSFLTVNVTTEVDFEILSAECNASGSSFTISVLSNGNTIISSIGEVVVVDENNVEVINIPIGSQVVVTAIDPVSFCTSDLIVSSPNCDCPEIPSPSSGGDITICEGDDIPNLSVTVESGLFANWYDVQSGGTILLGMSNTYTPDVTAPGVYSFFVEAEDENGCVSLTRTQVNLEIISIPSANDIDASVCQDESGEGIFDLNGLNAQINSNLSFEFHYFPNLADAENSVNEIIDSYITSEINSTLVVSVTSSSGCVNYAEVNLILLDLPEISFDIVDEICLGDMNGYIEITASTPIDNVYSLDDLDYTEELVFDSLSPGSYTLFSMTEDGCKSEFPFMINARIVIQIEDPSLECFSNGTASISDDDYYEISFLLDAENSTSTSFAVSRNGEDLGTFNYGETVMITLVADSENYDLDIIDDETGCMWTIPLGTLETCSTDCEIMADPITFTCDDNGTPIDPADDFYTINVNATAVNGASSNSFNVLVDGNPLGIFQYGVGGTIQLQADGSSPQISIVDNEDSQCFISESIGPLIPCSNECVLEVDIDGVCDNQGTVGVPDDDVYIFTYTVSGSNTSAEYNFIENNNTISVNNYNVEYTYTISADEASHDLEFVDVDDNSCSIIFNTELLIPCSGSCSIEASSSNVECNNENTASDENDDTFTATININLDGGTGTWLLQEENVTGSSTTVEVGPYLISDGDVILTISDLSIPSCNTIITIPAPEPCSVCDETVEAGTGFEIDCVITEGTLIGSGSMPGSPSWSGPGGIVAEDYELTTDIAGMYFFSIDFGEGCIVTDSVEVTVSNEIPTASAGEDMDITCEVDTVILSGSVTGGSGTFEYQWLDENDILISNDLNIEVTDPGNYYFLVVDLITDCSSPRDVVPVHDLTSGPSALISANPGNILDCVIEVIYITNENEENVVYTWMVDNEPISGEIVIDQPSEIDLIALDTITGCENSSSLSIPSLQEYPLISLFADGMLNCIDTEITLDGSGSQSGSTISSAWYDENNMLIANDVDEIIVTEVGIYYLELMDSDNGCVNRDTINVEGEYNFPIVTEADNVQLGCLESMITIGVDVAGTENYSINWNTNDGSIISMNNQDSISVEGAGLYLVSILDVESMCETIDSIFVDLPEMIEANIELMDESCEENFDGAIVIEEPFTGVPPFQYFIDGESYGTNIINGLSSGSYEVLIIDDEACEFDTLVTLDVLESFSISLLAEITVEQGTQLTIAANVDIPTTEIESVSWLPATDLSCDSCLTTILTATENTPDEYEVLVTDINGCLVTATIRVFVEETVEITFPNIISSNNDNNGNDNFTIYSSDENVTILTLKVFDRWGELVFVNNNFAPNNPALGWDGTFKDKNVNPGVYVYYSEILMPNGETESFSGDVTVIR